MLLTLRTPQPADYRELASWVPDAGACLRWAGPLVPFPVSADLLEAQLTVAGGSSYVLADSNNSAVGFAQHWVVTPGGVHLGRIIVAPSQRARGLGRHLCTELLARAKSVTAASTVTLRVYRDNHAARALYASLGFSVVEAESNAEVLFMNRCFAHG